VNVGAIGLLSELSLTARRFVRINSQEQRRADDRKPKRARSYPAKQKHNIPMPRGEIDESLGSAPSKTAVKNAPKDGGGYA
jgi:hypothetical protein